MLSWIKKIFPEGSVPFKLLRKLYKPWIPPSIDVGNFLEQFSIGHPAANFIQIGSNDGKTGDPIYKLIKDSEWKGILVEPVPYLFEKLVKNYSFAADRLHFENVAIGKTEGNIDFYYIRQSDDVGLPEWYNQLGSFDLSIIMKHIKEIPGLEQMIVTASLPTMNLDSLLKKYDYNTLDLLHIDTEGYDFEIIKMIDFGSIRPCIILFEHKHLTTKEYKQCLRLLKNNGYAVYLGKGDTIAKHKSLEI